MDLKPRKCTADDLEKVFAMVAGAFLSDPDEGELAGTRLVFEPERTYVIDDDDRPVGAAAAFSRELSVPGATIPAAHVTGVGVAATHRRRGLLTRLMTSLLDDVAAAGTEPVAVLWASEGSIYGRYGYGLASWNLSYNIATKETALPAARPPGTVRQVTPSEIRETLAATHDRVRGERPGVSSRPGRWWESRTTDPESSRHGWSAERCAVYEADGRVDGYVLWRTKNSWGEHGPKGEATVTEFVTATVDAYIALWQLLLSIDLVRAVRCRHAAVDEALPHLVTKPDALGVTAGPGLWVRVVDVPGALAARRYLTPIDVVLDVTDARLPANNGRWRLKGDGDSATCEPTTDEPDLGLDVHELGAAYLGGTSLSALGAAGLVTEHRAGSLTAASTAFGWHRAPWSHEVF